MSYSITLSPVLDKDIDYLVLYHQQTITFIDECFNDDYDNIPRNYDNFLSSVCPVLFTENYEDVTYNWGCKLSGDNAGDAKYEILTRTCLKFPLNIFDPN